MLAASGRATVDDPCLPGKARVIPRDNVHEFARYPTVERFPSEYEIADAIFAAPSKSQDAVVIVPIAQAARQVQLLMAGRERATHESLRTHVHRERRLSLEVLALSGCPLNPVTSACEELHLPNSLWGALLSDSSDRYGNP
jgi:hypothetical protein